MTAQCSFSLDPGHAQETPFGSEDLVQLSSPESAFGHDEEDIWSCPHPAAEENEYCVFHQGPDEVPSQEVKNAFLTAVEDANRPSEFYGARLDGLSVTDQTLEPTDGCIDLSHAIISDDLDFTGVTIDGDFRLTQASVDANTMLSEATIHGQFSCRNTTFDKRLLLHRAQLEGLDCSGVECGYFGTQEIETDSDAILDRFTCRLNADLGDITVGGTLSLNDADFKRALNLIGADVDRLTASFLTCQDTVDLVNIAVRNDLAVDHATFHDTVDARQALFAGTVTFEQCRFKDDMKASGGSFKSEITFLNCYFAAFVSFSEGYFAGDASFDGSVFEDAVRFVFATFCGDTSFDSVRFTDDEGNVHLRNVRTEGELSFTNVESNGSLHFAESHLGGRVVFADTELTFIQFNCTCDGAVVVRATECADKALFGKAVINGEMTCDHARFQSETRFDEAIFNEGVVFTHTVFEDEVSFDDVSFAEPPVFEFVDIAQDVISAAVRQAAQQGSPLWRCVENDHISRVAHRTTKGEFRCIECNAPVERVQPDT